MQEKSIKSNIICIIVCIVLGAGFVLGLGHICSDIFKIISWLIIFAIFWWLAITIISLVGKLHFNKSLNKLPYKFDYEAEFLIYRNIGKKKKEKVTKRLKDEFKIPELYTVWKKDLMDRHKKLVNDEDFYHYLKRSLRNAKNMYDILVAVLIPVEIAVLTVFLSATDEQNGMGIALLVSSAILAVLLTSVLYKSKDESEFVSDVIDILCYGFNDNKDEREI